MISQMLLKDNMVLLTLVSLLGFVFLYGAIWFMVLAPGAKSKAEEISRLPLSEDTYGK